MKRRKFLPGFIIVSILLFLIMSISLTANAQYFGPFGPYYIAPLAYGYGFNPFLPPAPVPFFGTFRNAAVVTPILPTVTATAPSVTPAGLSITTLVPPAPIGSITILLPVATPTVATVIAPTVISPPLVAPTIINPTLLAAPVATPAIPGITTAILFTSGGTGGGGSLTTLATLGLLPAATPTTLTTLGLLPTATPILPVTTGTATIGVATAALIGGGGGISTTALTLLGLI